MKQAFKYSLMSVLLSAVPAFADECIKARIITALLEDGTMLGGTIFVEDSLPCLELIRQKAKAKVFEKKEMRSDARQFYHGENKEDHGLYVTVITTAETKNSANPTFALVLVSDGIHAWPYKVVGTIDGETFNITSIEPIDGNEG